MEQLKQHIIKNKLTLLNKDKLEQFYLAIQNIIKKDIKGFSAELGIYKGGASLYISTLLNRIHYAFDTFNGIENSNEFDSLPNGSFSNVNENNVRNLLKNTKSVIVKGLFTGNRPNELFCFSHFDGDTYLSCKDFLNYFYKNTVKNGYIFFDDYAFHKAKGVQIAIDEFIKNNNDHQKAFISSNHQFCIIK